MKARFVAALVVASLVALALPANASEPATDRSGGPERSDSSSSCQRFASQASAQAFFVSHGGPATDVKGLDEDNDGVACSANPAPFRGLLNVGYAGRAFSGHIVSASDSCLGGRSVTVYKPRKGKPPKRVGATQTDDSGGYSVASGSARGKYYAKAKAASPCNAERSPTIAVPDRRVEIDPQGVLFTAAQQSRKLRAIVVNDASGTRVAAKRAWFHSSDQNVIAVTKDGMATAEVSNGSAQIVATVGGISSAPILAIVTRLPDDAVTLTDDQIEGQIDASDPDAEPSFDNTFDATLIGVPRPEIGALYIAVEDKSLVGRVESVEDLGAGRFRVTFSQVPIDEALPELSVDQSLAFANAPVSVDPQIAEEFGVTRSGTTFTFTQKAPSSTGTSRSVGPTDAGSVEEPCKVSVSTPLKFKALKVTFDVDGTFQLRDTADKKFESFIVGMKPSVSITGGVGVAARFEGKVECKLEFMTIHVPIGPLSMLFGAHIPVGAGIEASGKFTLDEVDVALMAKVGGTLEAGVRCAPDRECSFVREMETTKPSLTPKVTSRSSVNDGMRFEPEVFAYVYAEPSIGPFLESLRLTVFEAQLGVKLAGSFASREDQISDAGYRSDYKATLEATVSLAPDLGGLAKKLGADKIIGAELKLLDVELGRSPSGQLTADKQDFAKWDNIHFKLHLDHVDFFACCGPYNVDTVLLVRRNPRTAEIVKIKEQPAKHNQTDFKMTYTATDDGSVDEFYAFVVTKLVPIEELPLEIARAVAFCGGSPSGMRAAASTPSCTQEGTITVDYVRTFPAFPAEQKHHVTLNLKMKFEDGRWVDNGGTWTFREEEKRRIFICEETRVFEGSGTFVTQGDDWVEPDEGEGVFRFSVEDLSDPESAEELVAHLDYALYGHWTSTTTGPEGCADQEDGKGYLSSPDCGVPPGEFSGLWGPVTTDPEENQTADMACEESKDEGWYTESVSVSGTVQLTSGP